MSLIYINGIWFMEFCSWLLCTFVGDCSAGYYCTGGAWIPDPVDNTTGNICPQHHICKAGADTPKTCPIGYHANSTGMSDCQLCMAGFLCRPGSEPALCPLGKQETTFSSNANRFLRPKLIHKRVFYDSFWLSVLFVIPGYYCRASTVLIPISQGTPCPVGTFGDKVGLTEESNCTQCPAGTYCETTGKLDLSYIACCFRIAVAFYREYINEEMDNSFKTGTCTRCSPLHLVVWKSVESCTALCRPD